MSAFVPKIGERVWNFIPETITAVSDTTVTTHSQYTYCTGFDDDPGYTEIYETRYRRIDMVNGAKLQPDGRWSIEDVDSVCCNVIGTKRLVDEAE